MCILLPKTVFAECMDIKYLMVVMNEAALSEFRALTEPQLRLTYGAICGIWHFESLGAIATPEANTHQTITSIHISHSSVIFSQILK